MGEVIRERTLEQKVGLLIQQVALLQSRVERLEATARVNRPVPEDPDTEGWTPK